MGLLQALNMKIFSTLGVSPSTICLFLSLANKDLALSNPDPIAKVADVAGGGAAPYFEVAVGNPLDWDQLVPFFGRREAVKGRVYSYFVPGASR